MLLFFWIILISFLLAYSKETIKLLKVSSLIAWSRRKSSQKLENDLKNAEEFYAKTQSASRDNSYFYEIQCLRAERVVQEARSAINMERMMQDVRKYSVELIAGQAYTVILYLTLMIISVKNRYEPVITLDYDINLQPLKGLLSFPTGVTNAISVPIWTLSCKITFSFIADLIKYKKPREQKST